MAGLISRLLSFKSDFSVRKKARSATVAIRYCGGSPFVIINEDLDDALPLPVEGQAQNLQEIPASDIAKEIGKSERTVKRYRNLQSPPLLEIRYKLTEIAARYARKHLKSAGFDPRKEDNGAIFQYIQLSNRC